MPVLFFAWMLVSQGSQLPSAEPVPEEAPPSRFSIAYRPGIAARVNPLGLFISGNLMFRYRLYDSPALALKENYIGIGPVVFLSPAFARAGIGIEVQPLSILQLSASYEFIGFWKAFNIMQSYPTPTANNSDSQLSADKDTSYRTTGGILTLAALLQVKLGPIAVRSNFRAFHYMMNLRPGDTVWYEPILDIMSPKRGWTVTNDADLLYVTQFGFTAGARYTLTHSFFSASDYLPGETPDDPNGPTHRIGPFLAYTFFDKPEMKHFNTPTLVLLAQWFIRHRWRTGADVSQAFPWIALAFQFKGTI